MNATSAPVSGIDATYYNVTDLDRATQFYVTLLGMSPTSQIPNMISEWTFAGGESFGLYNSQEGEGDFQKSGGVMFAVDDVAAAVAANKARGVKFHGDIEDTPVCHMAFGEDSEGNGFILHRRK